jgi:hypothetical protein
MTPTELLAQAELLEMTANRMEEERMYGTFDGDPIQQFREAAESLRERAFKMLTEEREEQ